MLAPTVLYECPHCPGHRVPLAYLYYCTHCATIKCQLCTRTETALLYCPHCTFETPQSSLLQANRPEKGRCMRACFTCPSCEGSGVHAVPIVATLAEAANPTSPTTTPQFCLRCAYCQWTSTDTFRSTAGLGGFAFG